MCTVAPPVRKQKPRSTGPGSGSDRPWLVIVKNDNHNTFDGVAFALARTHPRRQLRARAWTMANRIHTTRAGGRLDRAAGAGRALLGAARRLRADDGAAVAVGLSRAAAFDPWQLGADPEWAVAIVLFGVWYAVGCARRLRRSPLLAAGVLLRRACC